MKSFGFPRARRMVSRGHFRRVQAEGTKVVTRHFVFLASVNGLDFSRLGLAVSRKVGPAVVRNRVKRVVREAFRLNRPFEGRGVDLVVIPRAALPKPAQLTVVESDFAEMERRLNKMLNLGEATP
ncbi:MAG: ribonuclease P protein component [Myxococcales bacterium]|nr:MAG: ribonuclease P protein component [Myxococcales bacterium]